MQIKENNQAFSGEKFCIRKQSYKAPAYEIMAIGITGIICGSGVKDNAQTDIFDDETGFTW